MWLSQLGKTIQPSDVLFNLTKFSNTLSEGIDLLIVDVVTKKEKIAIGKIFPYTENRFLALNKLTSKERLKIFHNYDENNQLYYHNSLMLSSSRWEEIVAESIMKFSQS